MQDGNVYTNAAYGMSEVTVQVDTESSIAQIKLEVGRAAAASD